MSDAAFLAATEDHVRIVREARHIVRQILADNTDLSGNEVLCHLDELVAEASAEAKRVATELVEESACRHCGHSIMRVGDSTWRHDAAMPMSRGCRAASFDRDGTWDDSLDRAWKATPPKGRR
ncbi:hypothetical protein [Streptomyces platensis]